MASNEVLDPSLVHGMQILKFVHCWKFLNVQAIWSNNIWKSKEKAEVYIFKERTKIFKDALIAQDGEMAFSSSTACSLVHVY